MKTITLIFFYGYVASLVVFGALGVFTAQWDQPMLFKLHPDTLGPQTAASMLSQYRFFRAIECGFGIFAFTWRTAIFNQRSFNRLFLGTMFGGVAARLISLALDGPPFAFFYVFLVWELVGGVLVFAYSRTTLKKS